MENKGLLFIPDISGFTRFVNETEIDHSRLIIQELLEIIISANEIGLQVSEIEGDAILFYKFGQTPDLEELYKQVEEMFCQFHSYLMAYDNRRYCQCKACTSAVGLSLKVITHYGEFMAYNVQQFSKLIGKDIIVAHQLLKNDIEQHEYWLITESLLQDNPPDNFTGWMKWNSSAKQTESGAIPFVYTQLSELKNSLQPEPTPSIELSKKAKVISLAREYETDIITLFHACGDFNYRNRWLKGITSVQEVNHFLPRVGMRYRCFMDDGQVSIVSSSYSYTPERIEFSETNEKDNSIAYYTLEKIASKKSKLTFDYYLPKNLPVQVIFNLTKKNKMEKDFQESLENLDELVKEIHLPELESI